MRFLSIIIALLALSNSAHANDSASMRFASAAVSTASSDSEVSVRANKRIFYRYYYGSDEAARMACSQTCSAIPSSQLVACSCNGKYDNPPSGPSENDVYYVWQDNGTFFHHDFQPPFGEETCKPNQIEANGSCILKLPEDDLNRADETCTRTSNPVNIATGNKYFVETDYQDTSNPLLNIIRKYDSKGGKWSVEILKSLSVSEDANSGIPRPSIVLTTERGAKASYVWEGAHWQRLETQSSDYIKKLPSGNYELHQQMNTVLTFSPSGRLLSEKSGHDLVQYNYEANGNITITDPVRNRSLTVSLDVNNNLEQVTLPNQNTIIYRYDDKGRLWQVENRGKLTTYFFEDTAWPLNITRVQDANGQTWKNISYYPDGRVHVSELNGGQERMTFTYPEVNTTQTTNALGKATTYTFVDLKGVKKVAKVEGHASTNCLAANQYYTYYPNGQIETKTDWKGVVTRFEYNDRHLESKRIEAAGTPEQRVITTTWHPEMNLPATVTVGNQVTIYEYHANGQLKSQQVSQVLK